VKRSDRLKPVRDLAGGREREAGLALAGLRRQLEEQERRLEQLRGFREEYVSGRPPGLGTTDAVRLANYGAFLGRLNEAIREQEKRIAALREEVECKAESWRERRSETAALDRAVERLHADERRALDRREQRDQDELAQTVRRPGEP
jgi:flagellar FliJ protein